MPSCPIFDAIIFRYYSTAFLISCKLSDVRVHIYIYIYIYAKAYRAQAHIGTRRKTQFVWQVVAVDIAHCHCSQSCRVVYWRAVAWRGAVDTGWGVVLPPDRGWGCRWNDDESTVIGVEDPTIRMGFWQPCDSSVYLFGWRVTSREKPSDQVDRSITRLLVHRSCSAELIVSFVLADKVMPVCI